MTDTSDILLDDVDADEKVRRLLPIVYEQLRAAANTALARERPDHTLQATALVHEAYLKLVGDREIPWANRAHFYAAAAEAMQRILIDHARSRGRLKRGGNRRKHTLTDVADLISMDFDEIQALDDAIRRLERTEPLAAGVVRHRFFAGLNVAQTASALAISPRQVNRLWTYARAWLFRELNGEHP